MKIKKRMREKSFAHLLSLSGSKIGSYGCKEGGSSFPICPLQGANADFKVAGKRAPHLAKRKNSS